MVECKETWPAKDYLCDEFENRFKYLAWAYRSESALGRLDSASAKKFDVPGRKTACSSILLTSHQSEIRKVFAQRAADLHPPSLLI